MTTKKEKSKHKRPFPGAKTCVCGSKIKRNDKHDSYYCTSGNTWVESTCGDWRCVFCKDRPEQPSQVTG